MIAGQVLGNEVDEFGDVAELYRSGFALRVEVI